MTRFRFWSHREICCLTTEPSRVIASGTECFQSACGFNTHMVCAQLAHRFSCSFRSGISPSKCTGLRAAGRSSDCSRVRMILWIECFCFLADWAEISRCIHDWYHCLSQDALNVRQERRWYNRTLLNPFSLTVRTWLLSEYTSYNPRNLRVGWFSSDIRSIS